MPEISTKKRGFGSSAFWATAPLSGAMLGAALTLQGLSDYVRVALIAGAVGVQIMYAVTNAVVKMQK
jgi:hypothetical protein